MKRVFSIVLSFILLSSNLGLAAGSHFCGGHFLEQKLILNEKSLTCGMEFMKRDCEGIDQQHTSFSKSECCTNEILSLQLNEDVQQSPSQAESPLLILVILSVIIFPLFRVIARCQQPVIFNSPPWSPGNRQVAFQQFLL